MLAENFTQRNEAQDLSVFENREMWGPGSGQWLSSVGEDSEPKMKLGALNN